MKLVVLLFAIIGACSAGNSSNRPVRTWKEPTVRTLTPFKVGMKYTYSYESFLTIPHPLIVEQTVGIKLQCKVHLRFIRNIARVDGSRLVRLVITEPQFSVIENNPTMSPVPIEQVLPEHQDIKKHLSRGLVFTYKDGLIMQMRMYARDSMWVRNIKRGIASLFAVNILGERRKPTENIVFKKVESTIFGKCDCVYNINDTVAVSTGNEKYLRIIKNIDTHKCRTPVDVTLSSVSRVFGTKPTETVHKTVLMMDYEVLKTKSGWKVISVEVNGTNTLLLLGEHKQPISTISSQTLRLIDELVLQEKVDIPKQMKIVQLKMEMQKELVKKSIPMQVRMFIYKKLSDLHKDMKNESAVYKQETLRRITELVQLLRPLTKRDLKLLWNSCVKENKPEMTALFLRIIGLVRTEDSMFVIRNNLPTWIPKSVVNELLMIFSTPIRVSKDMVKEVEKICNLEMIKSDIELRHACLLSYVTARKTLCEGSRQCLELPQDLMELLTPTKLITMKPKEILRIILIAETASEPSLLPRLLAIIRDHNLPLMIRTRSAMALKPLALKLREKLTNEIVKVLLEENHEDSDQLKVALYSVLLERPTLLTIHVCTNKLIKTEQSIIARRFVYETLLSLASATEIELHTPIRRACQYAVDILRTRRLVPSNSRLIPQHLLRVIKPITGSNIKLILKNQIHFSKTTALPKHLVSGLDAQIFGRNFNLLDMEVAVEGLEELLTKWMKASPEDKRPVTMNFLSSLRVLGQPMASTYMRINGSEDNTILERALPNSFLTWKRLANQINKEMNFESTKTMMPMEIEVCLPTSVGIPLVYNLTTVVMYHLESSMKTETPSVFNLPSLIFSKKDLSLTASSRIRSIFTLQGQVSLRTPLVSIGINHLRTAKVFFNTNVTMNLNIHTMKINSNIEMPKTPEIITTQCETSMFTRYITPVDKTVHKELPTMMEFLLPRMEVLGYPIVPEEVSSKVHLKAQNKFITVRPSTNNVILGDESMDWIMVPTPTNNRIVSLYVPTLGYVSIDAITKTLKWSPTERAYFFIDHVEGGFRLKTLVPVELEKVPTTEEMQPMFDSVFELVEALQAEGIVTEVMRRAIEMQDIDVLRAVKVMYLKLDLTKQARFIEVSSEATLVTKMIIEGSTQRIMQRARSHGICLNQATPFCLRSVLPKEKKLDVDTLMSPMFMEVALPSYLKRITIEHSLQKEEMQFESLTKIEYIGLTDRKRYEMKVKMNKAQRRLRFTIQQFNKDVPSDFLVCSESEYVEDSIKSTIMFDPKCSVPHIEFSTVSESKSPRYHLSLNWILRLRSLPLTTKRVILTIVERVLNQKPWTGFERIPLELSNKPMLREREIINGSIRLSLVKPQLLRIQIQSPVVSFWERDMPLPMWIESFPIGRTSLPLYRRLVDVFTTRVCKHSRESFITFNQVKYQQRLPTERCEHVLMQTRLGYQPSIRMTVRKHEEYHKAVKMIVGKVVIEVTPTTQPEGIPKIQIDGRTYALVDSKLRKEITKELVLEGVWILQERALVLTIRNLGIQMTMVAGKTIYTSLNTLLFHDKVNGMCGNIDLEGKGQMRSLEGIVLKDPTLFGLTWLVPGKQCSKLGCPLRRVEAPASDLKKCVPLIDLPVCMEGCSYTKRMTIAEMPMKCPGTSDVVLKSFDVDTDCECSC